MYKYVAELLQELGLQRPTSRQKPSKYFSTQDQKLSVKTLSPKEKRLKSYVLTKIHKIQAEKQMLSARKRQALIWYRMVLDKMIGPLIEYMPSVATTKHLSRLSDFRTTDGECLEGSEEVHHPKKIVARPKCVEEPLPILIKPEYKVSKNHKKNWRIFNKLSKARDSKNEMIKKYKLLKNKVASLKDPEFKNKITDKPGVTVYDLFLKDAVEERVDKFMPSIKIENKYSNVYDFRYKEDPEYEPSENNLLNEETLVSTNKLPDRKMNTSFNNTKTFIPTGFNHNKTVVPKTLPTKTVKKAALKSVNTKPLNISSTAMEETVPLLTSKATSLFKEEQLTKPNAPRSVHKQTWSKNDNPTKFLKSASDTKDQPITKKTSVPLKNKQPEINQLIDNTPSENKALKSSIYYDMTDVKENESLRETSNNNSSKAENVYEMIREKNNAFAVLENPRLGSTDTKEKIFDESNYSKNNITESSEKNFMLEVNENKTSHPEDKSVDHKAETALFPSVGLSTSLSNIKPLVLDEPNNIKVNSSTLGNAVGSDIKIGEIQSENHIGTNQNYGNLTLLGDDSSGLVKDTTKNDIKKGNKKEGMNANPNLTTATTLGDTKFTLKTDINKNEIQNGNQNKMLKIVNETNVKKDKFENGLIVHPKSANNVVEVNKAEKDKQEASVSNILKNTYLVSFEVSEDEGFLKTRRQVIADEIGLVGDCIDLNTVLKEEKKAREKRNLEESPEKLERSADNDSLFLNTFKSELQSDKKNNLTKHDEKNKENIPVKKSKELSSSQDVSSETSINNLSKTINNSSNLLDSMSNTSQITKDMKGKNIFNDNLDKKHSDKLTKPKNIEPSIKNIHKNEHVNSNSVVTVSDNKHDNKKYKSKKHSLEITGRNQKGKVSRHKIITEKERHLLSSLPEIKKKGFNEYQEIINSVKKIIPSENPNTEKILEKNTPHIGKASSDTKINVNSSKNYAKTINELKEIISELPQNDTHQAVSNAKHRNDRDNQIPNKKYSISSSHDENVVAQNKTMDNKANSKNKRVNLKAIKVVDHIAKGKHEPDTDKPNNGISLTSNGEIGNQKTQTKSNDNTFANKNFIENKFDSQIDPKGPSNVKKGDVKLSNPKSFYESDKIDEKHHSKEVSLKNRSSSRPNVKLNVRKSEVTHESLKLNNNPKSNEISQVETNSSNTRHTTQFRTRSKSLQDNTSNTSTDQTTKLIKGNKSVQDNASDTSLDQTTQLRTRNKYLQGNSSNDTTDQSYPKSKKYHLNKSVVSEIHKTHKDMESNKLRQATNFKLKNPRDQENNRIIQAKSSLNMSKIENHKTEGPNKNNTAPDTKRPGSLENTVSSEAGKLAQTVIDEVTIESNEKKSRDETNASLKENKPEVPSGINSTKTIYNENDRMKIAMDKFVASAKSTNENKREIIKFTRSNVIGLKSRNKRENDMTKSEKQVTSSLNSLNRKNSGLDSSDKQTVLQKSTQASTSELQEENNITNQPLTKKLIEVKTSSENTNRDNPSSKLTGDGKTLPKRGVQSGKMKDNDRVIPDIIL